MNKEMKTFKKKKTQRGKLLTCLKERYLLDVDGFSSLFTKPMELVNGARLVTKEYTLNI